MPEMNFKIKGPVGAVIGGIVICVFIYVQFFMPFSLTSREKKIVLQELENMRVAEMLQTSSANMKRYKETGQYRDDSKEIKALSGKIEITSIEGKKSLFYGSKMKVTYTIDGKTPKGDGGVLFFKVYRRKRRKSTTRNIIELTQITEDYYDK